MFASEIQNVNVECYSKVLCISLLFLSFHDMSVEGGHKFLYNANRKYSVSEKQIIYFYPC